MPTQRAAEAMASRSTVASRPWTRHGSVDSLNSRLQEQDEANFELEFSLYRQIIMVESYSWPLAREKSTRFLKKALSFEAPERRKRKKEARWLGPGDPLAARIHGRNEKGAGKYSC